MAASGDGSTARATGVVAAGMLGMNALAYAFTLISARLLGPHAFGGVSALLGILIVANVGALALQATAARRLATTDRVHHDGVVHDLRRTAVRMSVVLGAVLIALTPAIDAALKIDDWLAVAMLGLSCAALTLMGVFAGIVQGEHRWGPLASIYLAMGAGRVVFGSVALALEDSVRAAMLGVAVGSLVPALVGAWFCRTPRSRTEDHEPVLGELWRNGHALLAFFAFTNLDIVLARYLFSEYDSGIYAAGAILTKACLFLPTFVLVVAFPTMARERGGRPWLKPMVAVGALGLTAVAGTLVLPDLAVAFAGGDEYAELGDIAWVFALEGTAFALLQILVYDTIAGQTKAAPALWTGVAVTALIALALVETALALAALVTAVAVAVGLAIAVLVTGLVPAPAEPDRDLERNRQLGG